ncbi:MAG: YcaO-like family protein [Granulosicoccus sp.]
MITARLLDLFGPNADAGRKAFHNGTHRSQSPQQTLAWITPSLKAMGITRVADITGLDCIGIPVTMVVRPNSRSLAVSQGKGLCLASAQVSGIMESIETYHSEHISQPLKLTEQAKLRQSDRVINTDRMAKAGEHHFHDHVRMLWIQGIDLLTGEPVWLPYEAVHTDFTVPRPSGSGYFPANTNGLASGNCQVEATAHALYEVIERDAIALWHQRESYSDNIVELGSITDNNIASLLLKLGNAKMDVRVWNATSNIGIPCFHCLIIGAENQHADPEFGSGCHPDSHVALLRALTEAVQARTTFIAGSRDDFGSEPYSKKARSHRLRSCRNLMSAEGRTVDIISVASTSFDTVAEDLEWTLQQLKSSGINEVIWVNLSLSDFNIPVARVVVPGLEGAHDATSGDYVPGSRVQIVA